MLFLINPVAPFYEFYLAVTNYALPGVFIKFLGMSFFVYIFLALYAIFWRIK